MIVLGENKRDLKVGTKVKVNLKNKGYHIGIFIGMDELGAALVGVTETTIPNAKIQMGKKYISVFYTDLKKLIVLEE